MKINVEQCIYCILWSGGVLFALWMFCQATYGNYHVLDPTDFQIGWTIFHSKKDVSDIEWVVLTGAFKKYWILLFIQIVFSQIIFKSSKVLPTFYALYSIFCLVLILGVNITVIFLLYISVMCVVHTMGKKIFCYALTLVALYLLQQAYFLNIREYLVSEKMEGFLVDVGFAWLTARCLSFSVDRIDAQIHLQMKIKDISMILTYCLYLPVIFTGPILTYKSFVDQISVSHQTWTGKSFLKVVQLFLHPILGYFVLEFLLHYVYSSSVQYYPEIVAEFNAWALCGLGYALPILFYVKYFVIYSLCGAISKLEHIEFPPPPKCVSRIHSPSLLWRTFDRGLYLWILRYLYFPLLKGKWTVFRKIFALAASFSFVCVWHGMDKAVCAWTILNFLGVSFEMAASFLSLTKLGLAFEKYLSVCNKKRLRALVSTPHFMMMCISCSFFLSNWDIGVLLFKKIICSGLIPMIPTVFIMYCGCHVSLNIREDEENQGKK